jgi:hypothetical protein
MLNEDLTGISKIDLETVAKLRESGCTVTETHVFSPSRIIEKNIAEKDNQL